MGDAYDLIVIGAGNAGQEAASIARAAGWRVAIIEARDVGGTCPLRGCIPKKVLAAASEAADLVRRAPRLSINVEPPAVRQAGARLDGADRARAHVRRRCVRRDEGRSGRARGST